MKFASGTGTFVIALVVVIGSFGYMIARGGSDAVVMPIMAGSLGTVLSYFFAQHLSNGAATAAVATQMEANRAAQTAVDHAVSASAPASGTQTKGSDATIGSYRT